MHVAGEPGHGTSIADYVMVVRRRWWLLLLGLILVPLAAVLFSLRQERIYQGSAEVLLSQDNLAASLTGVQDQSLNQPADRVATTQAGLARVPTVVAETLRAAGTPRRSIRDFLDASSVSTKTNSDLLDFSVRDPDPALARRLATEYARQFTRYRRKLDTAALVTARNEVQTKINELESAGERRSALYASLVEKEQQLSTMEALKTSNASVVREAEQAGQVQPRPARNGILGVLLGGILGIGLVFLWEALDTRVRSADDISRRLGLPLLARIPAPPRKLRNANKLVMREEPHGIQAEAFRMLRTNLEFSRFERNARTIMVTSAVEQEGKSTTVANLAVALARAGQRVVLVDLDLRRPFVDRLFHLDYEWGVTQVVLGHATLDQALTTMSVEAPRRGRSARGGPAGENGGGRGHGALHVLPSGPVPPDPGEFVATKGLHTLLDRLREQADVVLVDAPPMLHVGDALVLSGVVDAVIVVTRANVVRRQMLDEVRRLLDTVPAQKLGFVLTGAESEEGYGYGGSYYYRSHERVAPLEESVL